MSSEIVNIDFNIQIDSKVSQTYFNMKIRHVIHINMDFSKLIFRVYRRRRFLKF